MTQSNISNKYRSQSVDWLCARYIGLFCFSNIHKLFESFPFSEKNCICKFYSAFAQKIKSNLDAIKAIVDQISSEQIK